MTGPGPSRRAEAFFRLLLRAYPRSFRERYGREAVEHFRDRLAQARRDGAVALARLWLRTVPLTLANGLGERMAEARGHLPAMAGVAGLLAGIPRSFRREPSVAVTVTLTLALGIGATVALFGVVRAALLQPLPYAEPDRLVRLWERSPEAADDRYGPSPLNFVDWRRAETELESMTAWFLTTGTYRWEGEVEEVRVARVSPDFFRVLGVTPALGRDVRAEEVAGTSPVVLSHDFWMRRFGGDSTVVGRSLTADGEGRRVVGVMPEGFGFPDPSVESWEAWELEATYAGRPETRTWRFLGAVGRIRPGATPATAERSLQAVAAALAEIHPEADAGWTAEVTGLRDEVVGQARAPLWTAFAAVLLLLLVACANVANLLLATVPARRRELAIRRSLGASDGRIVLELVARYAGLALLATALGTAVAAGLLALLVRLDAGWIPRLAEVRLDGGVVAFAAAVGALTAVVFGSVPAVHALRGSSAASLRTGTRATGTPRQQRARELFVASQVALAVLLLTSATALVRSFDRLRSAETGFEAEGVATFRVSLDPMEGGEEAIVQYYAGLEERLRALPGVVAVGATQTLPLNPVGTDFQRPYRRAGSAVLPADAPTTRMRIVTPGYREALGMTLLAGGDLPTEARLGEPRVALVNRTLARRLWGDEAPVGRALEIDFRDGWRPYTVVGVVEDVAHYGVRSEAAAEVFLSQNQLPYLAMTMVIRVAGDPDGWGPLLARTVADHPPSQPAHTFVSMERLLADSVAAERFLAVFLAVFAAIALVLAATGIHGVVAYVVSHQRKEIAVRMALGAHGREVVRAVTLRTLRGAAAGALVGGAGLLLAARLLDEVLYGVRLTAPAPLALVTSVLAALAFLAAWLPARRATRVPPGAALRGE